MIGEQTIRRCCFWVVLFLLPTLAAAQNNGVISGVVKSDINNEKLPFCTVLIIETGLVFQTDANGSFTTGELPYGNYTLSFNYIGYIKTEKKTSLQEPNVILNVVLKSKNQELDAVTVEAKQEGLGTMKRLRAIDGMLLSEGKKNEVIVVSEVNANKATNQGRQIYSRIPGLNIWESDGAGIQLGIGGRGLNPSRTSNFNTRQNGYDISADALGYPESYYTPPAEAIKEIQLIRGAASLQFGTQLGGLLNFKLNDGPDDEKLEALFRQTVGSFGLSNSFLSLGLNKNKWKGYSYFQYKQGDDWRPNSNFKVYSGAFNIKRQLNEKAAINLEFTKMYYLAHQPGGITDQEFFTDPSISNRSRNWFEVDWNLAATAFDYTFNPKTKFKTQFFGLLASRNALGVLGNISRPDDPTEERNLITGEFKNFGNETRFLHTYTVGKNYWAYLVGARYYQGYNLSMQGKADASDQPNFSFVSAPETEGSRYEFPSRNVAVFTENIFRVNKHFSIAPGLRFEYILTTADGSFSEVIYDLAGNTIFDSTYHENRTRERSIAIGGIGFNYKFSDSLDIYANFSQNYRSINFADMQIQNSNFRIDPNLQDETGVNMDLGFRGAVDSKLNYDISGFMMLYNNRIGNINAIDSITYVPYRLRTNVSKAITQGVEAMVEVDWWKVFYSDTSILSLRTFVNVSVVDARYTSSENTAYKDKKVELVPPLNLKTGITVGYKKLSVSYQYSYVKEHFSDATNAGKDSDGNSVFIPGAVVGIIPSYSVMDLSLKYAIKRFQFEAGCNNLGNSSYFTRRATGYPGPGIIPSPVRNYYFTLQVRI